MNKPSKFWPRFVVALLVCHASAIVLAVNVALSGHDSRDLREVSSVNVGVESSAPEALRDANGEGAAAR
ncbi:MAG: hypothetical protein ACYTFV_02170 [Planctomycetota bacterium]|jgi:hypothetical protein